jgi:hypothetical protein
LDEFTRWEQDQMKDFNNIPQILHQVKNLCLTHSFKVQAGDAMAVYGREILNINISQTSALASWKNLGSHQQIPEYSREEEEDVQEVEDVGVPQEEHDAGVPVDRVIETFSTSSTAKDLSCALFGSFFQCESVVLSVSEIIHKRTSAKAKSSSVWIPLTSRSVERMFSEWRRKTEESSEI